MHKLPLGNALPGTISVIFMLEQKLKPQTKYEIYCPEVLSLFGTENHDGFFGFIRELKRQSRKWDVLFLNFEPCREIKANALLVLYATIENLCAAPTYACAIKIRVSGTKRDVRELIEKYGLSKAGSKNRNKIEFKKISVLPVQNNESATDEDIIDYVQYSVFKGKLNAEQENTLGSAISETIENVEYHAYGNANLKPWWAICVVIKSIVHVIIYDIGQGIPGSIPSGIFPIYTDADIINQAMKKSESSTKIPHRGLGSERIKKLVELNQGGKLHILSGKGDYKYSQKGGESVMNHKNTLKGTLIQWHINIENI